MNPLYHNGKMLSRNTTETIITKFLIIVANFALVVATTRLWGSEGRGEIALVLANISIIAIFSNIFCGSTIAYHAPKMQRDLLLSIGFTGAILVSLSGSIIFSGIYGFRFFWFLFLIALFLSLTTAVSSYWLGKNNVRNYNLLTLLNPVFVLISLAFFYLILNKTNLNTYYQAYYTGTGIVVVLGIAGILMRNPYKMPGICYPDIKSILNYGVKNEFNYLIQFLNYRLSYYFIAEMLGFTQLGVFSVVVSISEAVWIISRSMSAVHFSNVINSDDQLKNRHDTVVFARQSFFISIALLVFSVLIPGTLYQAVFGNEFGDVRRFIIYLLPGIIAIAVSNLYGHYFAGTGNLKILRDKSLLGLALTLILMPLLVKKYHLTGACISLNISYILSSVYLWICFRRETKSSNIF